MNVGIILGAFWHHFGSQNAFKNRKIFFMHFWRPNWATLLVIWGRLGGMRGVLGEDNGGVRERTPDKNRGREPRRRQGTLDVWSSTPSPVGRRNASRIPPRRVIQVVWLFVCLFVVCLFVYLLVGLFVFCLFVCFICLFACLLVRLFVCLFVCV